MKTIKIILAIIAISTSTIKAQFVKAELQVSGLTCSMCSKATEKSLRSLDFITDIKPDLNRNLFIITFKNNTTVNLDQIGKKVRSAGFSVNRLTASFNFNNVKVSDNYHFNYGGNIYHFMNVAEKTLNGSIPITIIDKDFIPGSDFKKNAANTTFGCYKTGLMGSQKVYHVTI